MFKSNGGFTLVELIVVIAILGILAGIAIPAYSGYISKANDAKVITQLDAVATAAQAANATAGAVSKITVSSAGAVTVEPTPLATSFYSDCKLFLKDGYTVTDSAISINNYANLVKGSSYDGKTITWTAADGWKAN